MFKDKPSPCKTYFVNLPSSRLHVMESGQGEPLIMVPATISELENWRTLAQFMAQWFHVYFFELPGHGQSEAFEGGFSSQKVGKLVGQLADELGCERFNLMGFSFGGILALQTFKLHSHRIDRIILIAPCLGRPALPFSSLRLSLLHRANQFLSHPKIQEKFVSLIHNPHTVSKVVKILQKVGKLEDTIPLQEKLPRTKGSTIEVLNAQINEILTTDFEADLSKYDLPCYFAMSEFDPLLRFDTTQNILQHHFANLSTVRLGYPFHQPPAPFTYDELNRTFYETVDSFIQPKNKKGVRHAQQKIMDRDSGRDNSDINLDLPTTIDRLPAMVQ
jgi:pimeloyl-ACP methyl ester carboxylesterase